MTVGVTGVGFGVAVRKEPRPWDGFAFGFVLSFVERLNVLIFHNASDSGMLSEIRCKGRNKKRLPGCRKPIIK